MRATKKTKKVLNFQRFFKAILYNLKFFQYVSWQLYHCKFFHLEKEIYVAFRLRFIIVLRKFNQNFELLVHEKKLIRKKLGCANTLDTTCSDTVHFQTFWYNSIISNENFSKICMLSIFNNFKVILTTRLLFFQSLKESSRLLA